MFLQCSFCNLFCNAKNQFKVDVLPTNTIEITIIASKKSGILPILMRKLGSLGLIYRRCGMEEYDGIVKLKLTCNGVLDCSEEYLIHTIKNVPNVDSVVSVTQGMSNDTKPVKEVDDEIFDELQDTINQYTALHPLRANDAITHDILQIVEDRLSLVFGPVTNILLKSAAKKSSSVGELFLILAEKLTTEQRDVFLKNVQGLEHMKVTEHLQEPA
ncbi:MAG: hypothetical protein ACI88H_003390 [Cocleimonas sp.]